MPTPPAIEVSVSRVIAADPQTLYAIISDVESIGERSPETTSAAWVEPGRTFRGQNRLRAMRWTTTCTVTADDPGRTFAFETSAPSRSQWRYDLAPVAGGTRVTESVRKQDPQPLPIRWMQRLAGVTDRTEHLRHGITTTLERLADAAVRHPVPTKN